MKKNIVFLMMVLSVSIMLSCSSDSDNQWEDDATQIVKYSAEIQQKINDGENNSNNSEIATTRADDNGGNFICYNGTVRYDKECDGKFEYAVNTLSASWNCCWNEIGKLVLEADQKNWCIDFQSDLQCRKVSCDQIPPLCPSEWQPF